MRGGASRGLQTNASVVTVVEPSTRSPNGVGTDGNRPRPSRTSRQYSVPGNDGPRCHATEKRGLTLATAQTTEPTGSAALCRVSVVGGDTRMARRRDRRGGHTPSGRQFVLPDPGSPHRVRRVPPRLPCDRRDAMEVARRRRLGGPAARGGAHRGGSAADGGAVLSGVSRQDQRPGPRHVRDPRSGRRDRPGCARNSRRRTSAAEREGTRSTHDCAKWRRSTPTRTPWIPLRRRWSRSPTGSGRNEARERSRSRQPVRP